MKDGLMIVATGLSLATETDNKGIIAGILEGVNCILKDLEKNTHSELLTEELRQYINSIAYLIQYYTTTENVNTDTAETIIRLAYDDITKLIYRLSKEDN